MLTKLRIIESDITGCVIGRGRDEPTAPEELSIFKIEGSDWLITCVILFFCFIFVLLCVRIVVLVLRIVKITSLGSTVNCYCLLFYY